MSGPVEAFVEIGALLGRYFEGLRLADPERLADVLHPGAVYATAAGDAPVVLRREEYLRVVAGRRPASPDAPSEDEIVSVEIAGPETALAKVRCRVGNRRFVDFLSLVRVAGRWWIVAKVFHHDGGSLEAP